MYNRQTSYCYTRFRVGMLLRYIKLFAILGLLIGLVVVAVGCASAPKALETEADFIGFITEIHPIGRGDTLG